MVDDSDSDSDGDYDSVSEKDRNRNRNSDINCVGESKSSSVRDCYKESDPNNDSARDRNSGFDSFSERQ